MEKNLRQKIYVDLVLHIAERDLGGDTDKAIDHIEGSKELKDAIEMLIEAAKENA